MPMKVTRIETHHIKDLGYHDWCDYAIRHYANTPERTIYVAHTDSGLEGIGEAHGPPVGQDVLDHYLDTDPFDHLLDETHLGLGMAMYDLMGKHIGAPHREWAAAGTMSLPVRARHTCM